MAIFFNLSRGNKLVERAKALKVSSGTEPDADLGPLISKQVCTCSGNFFNYFAPSLAF